MLIRDYFTAKNLLQEIVANHLGGSEYKLSQVLRLYRKFSDEQSKRLFIKFLVGQLTGNNLSATPQYLTAINEIKKTYQDYGNLEIESLHTNLPLMSVSPFGYQIRLNTAVETAAAIFAGQQYQYNTCKAEIGNTVIDAGAKWGESTLYFSHEVGANGNVHSFESAPECMTVFQHNINYNPHISPNIRITKDLFRNITIDDYVKQQDIKWVDFIKIDVDGSERNILVGAKDTLKRCRPKLAIQFPNKAGDFLTLLNHLTGLKFRYRFYLAPNLTDNSQIVLFTIPKRKKVLKTKKSFLVRAINKALRLSGLGLYQM